MARINLAAASALRFYRRGVFIEGGSSRLRGKTLPWNRNGNQISLGDGPIFSEEAGITLSKKKDSITTSYSMRLGGLDMNHGNDLIRTRYLEVQGPAVTTGKGNDSVFASQLIQITFSYQGQSQLLLGPGDDRLSISFRGYNSSNPLTMETGLQIFENHLLDTGAGNDTVTVKLQSSKPSS